MPYDAKSGMKLDHICSETDSDPVLGAHWAHKAFITTRFMIYWQSTLEVLRDFAQSRENFKGGQYFFAKFIDV